MIQLKPIQSTNTVMTVSGKVLYNDRRRIMNVKKPIRDLFEKGENQVGYIMELCLTEEKTVERIRELSGRNITPVILYFTEAGK
jgi:hypothetical protein